jgi:hypothetical protein
MTHPQKHTIPARHSRMTSLALAAACLIALPMSVAAQDSDNHNSANNSLDVRSTVGDMHLGADAKPADVGLPVYPHARYKRETDKDSSNANLSLFTQAFGVKLVVLHYESDDPSDKIVAFYKDQLKKYGKVLECHTSGEGTTVDSHDSDDSKQSKELKCEGDNKGPNTELKAGTENSQHAVAIEPNKSGSGTTFSLVYVYSRGKQGDI